MDLRFFSEPIIVDTSKEVIVRADNFAKQVIDTVNYSDSNQFQKTKIQNDHFISKIGEEAVKKVFEEKGFTVEGLDYKIYKGKDTLLY